MKKSAALLLILALSVSLAACGGGKEPSGTEKDTGNMNSSGNVTETESQWDSGEETESEYVLSVTEANQILTDVWNSYKDEEKFMAVGGHLENYTDNAPAKYDITQVDALENSFCIPKESIELVDDVATLQHAMNVNNFSAAVYHLKDGANMEALVDSIKNMTMNNQWLCGFPERLIMITVGDEYLVTAFGSGDLIDHFKTTLLGLYENIPQFIVDEDL